MKMEIYACVRCGARREIWRKDGHIRKQNHKKTMFCAGCQNTRSLFIKQE